MSSRSRSRSNSGSNYNVNYAVSVASGVNARNVATEIIQKHFKGGYFKITGYNASAKYPGGFTSLKPFLNKKNNANIKKVSGLTANYRESNRALDAIQFRIKMDNGLHAMRFYKSGTITIVGGLSKPLLASQSLNVNRIKAIPLAIVRKVLPDIQSVKINSVTMTRHLSRTYKNTDEFRNFLHTRPETNEKQHVFQFKLDGTVVQMFPAKGTIVVPGVKLDDIQNVVARINSFIKRIPVRFIKGAKLYKQKILNARVLKAATKNKTVCPKKDCPVPYTFGGICQPKNGISRFVFPEKATGKPCCFQRPKSTQQKDKIIRRFADFGIDIPAHIKPILGLPSTYTRGESSRKMSFVKRGNKLMYNNKNISHRSFKKPNLEKLAKNVGVNVASMKKKTAPILLNAIEKTARSKGLVKNITNRPFVINGNSFKPFYGFGTKQEMSSMPIEKILNLTRNHYGINTRRKIEGLPKKSNIARVLKQILIARYPNKAASSSSSSRSSSSYNSNFNRELVAMIANRNRASSSSSSSSNGSYNLNFNKELTNMLSKQNNKAASSNGNKNKKSSPKRLEMLAKANREEL